MNYKVGELKIKFISKRNKTGGYS